MGPNTSIMDSSKHGISKSEFEDQSVVTGQQYDYKVSINKIKNVFKLLINECPFLIDDKAWGESQNKPIKDQFTIQIDSIRKSLGIDNMDDVELLVMTFYEYSDRHREDQLGQGHEDDEEHTSNNNNDGKKVSKKLQEERKSVNMSGSLV